MENFNSNLSEKLLKRASNFWFGLGFSVVFGMVRGRPTVSK